MSDEKKIPGIWTDKVCAYSDSVNRCPVIAATPNGDAQRKGYLHYLSFINGRVFFQIGPVCENLDKVVMYTVPKEVGEAAIQAAIGVVLLWQQSAGVKEETSNG